MIERRGERERERERDELTRPNRDTDHVSEGVMELEMGSVWESQRRGDCANMQGMRYVTSGLPPLQFDDVCEHVILSF